MEWLRQGSWDEDESLRFFNHFYDPIYNRGLAATARLLPLGVPVPLRGERSYEWGLEVPREFAGQNYSYRDAQRYYLLSLTERDPKDRERWLAETFYTLGHVIHLIQDMASPAHTRNAPHGGVIGPLDAGPLSVVEKYLNLDAVRAGLKFDGYPIPNEGFTRPRDFWVETDANGNPRNGPSARGLSQIINRNFVSEGTNFTVFVDGNHAVEYLNPVLNTTDCYEEEVNTQDAATRPVSGLVTFCRNSFRDPNTGVLETIPRMTTFSLFSRDLRERGKTVPGGEFSLNALNAWSIGQLTIPRAVGYSAGLLQYFFRGKLDVSRAADPATGLPSLRIVNRSSEELGKEGVLTLYQDDPQGNRAPVPGATLTLSAAIPKDNDDAPLDLPIPPDLPTGGLTLVYRGPLGLEQEAVLGKVVPEVVVEEVYRDWDLNEWILRTKDGLYVLPLAAVAGLSAPPATVRWGDRDNQLVAVTAAVAGAGGDLEDGPASGGGDPYLALLFELDRPVGSPQVPTTGAPVSGLPVAAVRLGGRIDLYEVLEPLDLNTTVRFTGRLQFAQYLPTYTEITTCEDVDPEEDSDWYECVRTEIGGDALDSRVNTWNGTVNATFPLQLTRGHQYPPNWPSHYRWSLAEVRADRAGHLVAVVKVETACLPSEEIPREVPVVEFDATGGLVKSEQKIRAFDGDFFCPQHWVWAVVELTERRLLAKSSPAEIILEATHRAVMPPGRFPVGVRSEVRWIGGKQNGRRDVGWGNIWAPINIWYAIPFREGPVRITDGRKQQWDHVEGLFRPSLAALGLGQVEAQGTPEASSSPIAYRWDLGGETAVTLRAPNPLPPPGPPAGSSPWMHWAGPVPGWLRFQTTAATGFWEEARRVWLATWNLRTDDASLMYVETTPSPRRLLTANASGVLTARRDEEWRLTDWTWLPWAGVPLALDLPPAPDEVFEDGGTYVALDPNYLYNVVTGRFHTPRPGLPAEAGPPPLVPRSSPWASGTYHVVGR